MEKIIDDVKYVLDESRIKEIQLPYFTDNSLGIYYAPNDKVVFLPINYQVVFIKKQIQIKGSLLYPKKISCSINIDNDIFFEIFIDAILTGQNLLQYQDIKDIYLRIQNQIYYLIANKMQDFVLLNQNYDKFNVFIISKEKDIIGITNRINFFYKDCILKFNIIDGIGTYLSYFSKVQNLNKNINVLMLTEKGEPFLQAIANIEKAFNQTMVVKKTKIIDNINQNLINKCQDIQKKYNKNYIKYFLDSQRR